MEKNGIWHNLFEAWGNLKKTDVDQHLNALAGGLCQYDKDNLMWLHTAIRNSIGPHLHARLDAKAMQVTGLGLLFQFLAIMAKMNSSIVHKLMDDLKSLICRSNPRRMSRCLGRR